MGAYSTKPINEADPTHVVAEPVEWAFSWAFLSKPPTLCTVMTSYRAVMEINERTYVMSPIYQ